MNWYQSFVAVSLRTIWICWIFSTIEIVMISTVRSIASHTKRLLTSLYDQVLAQSSKCTRTHAQSISRDTTWTCLITNSMSQPFMSISWSFVSYVLPLNVVLCIHKRSVDRVLTLSTNNNKNCIYNSFQWILLSSKCKSTKNDILCELPMPRNATTTRRMNLLCRPISTTNRQTLTRWLSHSRFIWSIVLTEFNQFRLFLFNFWFSLHLSLSSVHTQRNTVGISFNSVSRFSTADNHITLSTITNDM